ncbi:MAG: hypothetical protein PHQ74_06750 [Crocinitomicaceae bacterium]|nr:hypothetical protein [Crocinitomicaceae bacterium]
MDKKKILVVSSSFFPKNSPRSFRTTELVKELCRQGHDVTLYTIKNNEYHLSIEEEFGVRIKDLGARKLRILNINSGSKIVVLVKRIINRVLLQLIDYPDIELMFKVKKALKKETEFYDLMITIAAPHPTHWGTAWARSEKNPIAKAWVADCGDPFMMGIYDSFKKIFYFKYLEKWFCRKADFISIPRITMKENYYPEFHSKIIEISQGFKFDTIKLNNDIKNPIPTFAFAGSLIETGRNPSQLLTYLSSIDKPFKFIMYTENIDLVAPFQSILKDKLEVRNYIPRNELLTVLSQMDFLVNIAFDPVHQSPSKLIDYYILGKPILSSLTNEFDTDIVMQFLEGNYEQQFIISNPEQYRIENVVKEFLKLS